MGTKKGVIYILTNPSFKEYVKIEYADDVENDCNSLIVMNVHHLYSAYMLPTK